jgi:hypothetical protein
MKQKALTHTAFLRPFFYSHPKKTKPIATCVERAGQFSTPACGAVLLLPSLSLSHSFFLTGPTRQIDCMILLFLSYFMAAKY